MLQMTLNKLLPWTLLLVIGCSFKGTSSLKKGATISLSKLSTVLDGDKIQLAGTLMIESITADLFEAGFTLAEVKTIVAAARTEVSLAASLAIENSTLTLSASSANPYAVATAAVTRGALKNTSVKSFAGGSEEFSFELRGDSRSSFSRNNGIFQPYRLSSASDVEKSMKRLKVISGGAMKALGSVQTEMGAPTSDLVEATSEVTAQAASSIVQSGIPQELFLDAAKIIATATIDQIQAAGLATEATSVVKNLTQGTMAGISTLVAVSSIGETAGDISKTFIEAIATSEVKLEVEVKNLISAVSQGAIASLDAIKNFSVESISSFISEVQKSSFEAVGNVFSGQQAAEIFVEVAKASVDGLKNLENVAITSTELDIFYKQTIAETSSAISNDLKIDATIYSQEITAKADAVLNEAIKEEIAARTAAAASESPGGNHPCQSANPPKSCQVSSCDAFDINFSDNSLITVNFYALDIDHEKIERLESVKKDELKEKINSLVCKAKVPSSSNGSSCPLIYFPNPPSIESVDWILSTDAGVDLCRLKYTPDPDQSSGSETTPSQPTDPCLNANAPLACQFNYCDQVNISFRDNSAITLDFYNLTVDGAKVDNLDVARQEEFNERINSFVCRPKIDLASNQESCPSIFYVSPPSPETLAWLSHSDSGVTYCQSTYTPDPNNDMNTPPDGGTGGQPPRIGFNVTSLMNTAGLYGDISNQILMVGTPQTYSMQIWGDQTGIQTRLSLLKGCGVDQSETLLKDWDTNLSMGFTPSLEDADQCPRLQFTAKYPDSIDTIDASGSSAKGDGFRIYPVYIYSGNYPYTNWSDFHQGWIKYSNKYSMNAQIFGQAGTLSSIKISSYQTTGQLPDQFFGQIVQSCDGEETVLLDSGSWMSSNADFQTFWEFTMPSSTHYWCEFKAYIYTKSRDSNTSRDFLGSAFRQTLFFRLVGSGLIPPSIFAVDSVSLSDEREFRGEVLRINKPVTIRVTAMDTDAQTGEIATGTNLEYQFVRESRCGNYSQSTTLQPWSSSNVINYTPTSADVMSFSNGNYRACAFIKAMVRDSDGIEYMGTGFGDTMEMLSLFVTEANVAVALDSSPQSEAALSLSELPEVYSGQTLKLDLSSVLVDHPTMTEARVVIGADCYPNFGDQLANYNYYYNNNGTNYVALNQVSGTTKIDVTVPAYLSCGTNYSNYLWLRVLLRDSDTTSSINPAAFDHLHDLDIAIPGRLKAKFPINVSGNITSVRNSDGSSVNYSNGGPQLTAGLSLMDIYANQWSNEVSPVDFKFELLHFNANPDQISGDCVGEAYSVELISDWAPQSTVSSYLLQNSSLCTQLRVLARNNDAIEVKGPGLGDGWYVMRVHTAPMQSLP